METLPPEISLKIISSNLYAGTNLIYCSKRLYQLKILLIEDISRYNLKNIIEKDKYISNSVISKGEVNFHNLKYDRFHYHDIRYSDKIIEDINSDIYSINTTNIDFLKFHKTIIQDSWNIKSYKEFKLLLIILNYKLYNLTDYNNHTMSKTYNDSLKYLYYKGYYNIINSLIDYKYFEQRYTLNIIALEEGYSDLLDDISNATLIGFKESQIEKNFNMNILNFNQNPFIKLYYEINNIKNNYKHYDYHNIAYLKPNERSLYDFSLYKIFEGIEYTLEEMVLKKKINLAEILKEDELPFPLPINYINKPQEFKNGSDNSDLGDANEIAKSYPMELLQYMIEENNRNKKEKRIVEELKYEKYNFNVQWNIIHPYLKYETKEDDVEKLFIFLEKYFINKSFNYEINWFEILQYLIQYKIFKYIPYVLKQANKNLFNYKFDDWNKTQGHIRWLNSNFKYQFYNNFYEILDISLLTDENTIEFIFNEIFKNINTKSDFDNINKIYFSKYENEKIEKILNIILDIEFDGSYTYIQNTYQYIKFLKRKDFIKYSKLFDILSKNKYNNQMQNDIKNLYELYKNNLQFLKKLIKNLLISTNRLATFKLEY